MDHFNAMEDWIKTSFVDINVYKKLAAKVEDNNFKVDNY